MVGSPVLTNDGYRVELQRKVSNNEPYGKEYGQLLVLVTKMTRDTLRIKVVKRINQSVLSFFALAHIDLNKYCALLLC